MQQWAAPVLGAGAPGWALLRVLSLSPRRWLPAQLLLAAAGWGSNEDTLRFRQFSCSFSLPSPFLLVYVSRQPNCISGSLRSPRALQDWDRSRRLRSSGADGGWQPAKPRWSLGGFPPNPTVVNAFLRVTWLEL